MIQRFQTDHHDLHIQNMLSIKIIKRKHFMMVNQEVLFVLLLEKPFIL